MGRALAVTVILQEDGLPVVLLAGTVPTKEQAAQIDNPKAWADEAEDEDVEVDEPVTEDDSAVKDEAPVGESDDVAPAEVPEVEAPAAGPADQAPAEPEAPKRSGRKS